ncbi:ssDNA-specific exonuclease RecJ (plasmid) [Mesorhizobium loti]|nr:ssDNA-specific exonuclease RecJ [Mesorhizobium loti]
MDETAQTPMPLLTPGQRDQLLANGRQPGADHVPVVKFFNPVGIGTWLATELDADNDTCFGLADLGFPEIGSFSLEELASLSLPFGMHIERDILFTAVYPLSAYAEAAHGSGTRATIFTSSNSLRDRAETETISSRPKMHRYNRRMSNWSGADEEAYLRILDRLTGNAAADLERLRCCQHDRGSAQG